MPATNKAVSNTPRRVDIAGTIDLLDLSTMGGRIAWARIRKELRQEDVADRLGKSRATVVQYEKNNIMPPIPEVERLAATLDVSPEFLAFGRQGVDAVRNNKTTMVTVPEMSMGGKRLFQSGEAALPKRFFEKQDISPERTRMFVLDHDEDEFMFFEGDSIAVDQSAKDLRHSDRDLFLCQIGDGRPAVFRREGLTQTGKVKLMDGKAKTHMYAIDEITVLGSVHGGLVSA
jgi:transcriptional regulator with XRE-family HTH domain